MQKSLFLIILCLLLQFKLSSQSNYPQNDFRSPVDSTISLAGNFGEIRPNHFHAGFDIRTNNKEGIPIYAIADGYISRIKISAFGYGKALYISHSNGYTSVYAHLKSFHDDIQSITSKIQLQQESYEIDSIFSASVMPIKKGELIGLSGNTGGSQGPHLHFEIRDSKTEMPINPYFFGYQIADTVKPRVTQLAIYPLNEFATINGKNLVKKIVPAFKKGKYSYLKTDTITVNGKIGFGIECYDTETRSTNKNGIFSLEMQSGGKRIYYQELEKFTFENSRYVNTHIDYVSKQKQGTKIQKCFVSKNNQSGIYKDLVNDGGIHFTDDSIHWIRFILRDYAGNTTELSLKVKSTSKSSIAHKTIQPTSNSIDCLIENTFLKDDFKASIPAAALYDDVVLNYSKRIAVSGLYSPIHQFMNDETALQKPISISLKTIDLPDSLQEKVCVVSINKKGGKSYEGGIYKDGWVNTKTKTFGNYAVTIDTVPPKIKPAFKFVPNTITNLSKSKTIGILASDNLSGIKKYRATIDGKWVLCEYEFKQNLLFYTFDESILPGTHRFEIKVSDDKGNSSFLFITFKR